MSVAQPVANDLAAPPGDAEHALPLAQVPVTLLGDPRGWFTLERDREVLILRPKDPLPARCTIRPAGLFEQDRGFPEANMVMGRLVFASGATQEQRYRAFTRDRHRRLRELFLPVEAAPNDDWPNTPGRWRNFEAIAKRLCEAAGIPWAGLSAEEVGKLVKFVPWAVPEPVEGCLLHALAQWTYPCGRNVIEIGSFRGRSASMLAMALRGVGSNSPIISIDPHSAEPHNLAHVRLALAQIGEEHRLVQIARPSHEAWCLLRPSSAALVFIDGDHTFEQVLADFNNYRDLLAPGGVMAFHDYGSGEHNGLPEAHPGVRPAIDEQVMSATDFKPVLLGHTLMVFVKTHSTTGQHRSNSAMGALTSYPGLSGGLNPQSADESP